MEVSRRTALVALSTLAVAGCGVRLDVPPPEPPPPPDDPAGPDLLQERARAAAALMVANGVDAPLARALRPVHAEQVALLEEALTRLVPPPATLTLAPTAPETAPATAPTLEDLARAEGAGRDPVDRQAWERFSPRFASLLVGSIAQRSVAHALVAGPATPLPIHVISGPIGERVLAAHRSAAYGVEVAAAHLREGRRAVAVEVLADLRRVEEQLVADLPEAPPRPLGYALPETVTVTDADSASALLQAVLERLTDVVVAAAGPTAEALRAGGAAGAGAVGTLIDLATAAELARVRCGGPLAPGVPARTMARAEGPAPVSPGLASPPAG